MIREGVDSAAGVGDTPGDGLVMMNDSPDSPISMPFVPCYHHKARR
jgi:hypothetical protein